MSLEIISRDGAVCVVNRDVTAEELNGFALPLILFVKDTEDATKTKGIIVYDTDKNRRQFVAGGNNGEFIPLSGTTEGNPVTGNIKIAGNGYITGLNQSNAEETRKNTMGFLDEFHPAIIMEDSVNGNTIITSYIYEIIGLQINSNDPNFVGIFSAFDHSEKNTDNKLIYAQRSYVEKLNSILMQENCIGVHENEIGVKKPLFKKIIYISDLSQFVGESILGLTPFLGNNENIVDYKYTIQSNAQYAHAAVGTFTRKGISSIPFYQNDGQMYLNFELSSDGIRIIKNSNFENLSDFGFNNISLIAVEIMYTKNEVV